MFNFIENENFYIKLAKTFAILSKYYDIPLDCTQIFIKSKYKEIPNILANDIKDFEAFLLYFQAIQKTIHANSGLDISLDNDITKLTLKIS